MKSCLSNGAGQTSPVSTTLKKQEQTTSSIWQTTFQFNIIKAFCCQYVCLIVSNDTQKLTLLFCPGKKMNEITHASMRVGQELEYCIDVCRVTHGAHIENL